MFCGSCHPSPVGFTESALSDVGVLPGEAEKEWHMCAYCSDAPGKPSDNLVA